MMPAKRLVVDAMSKIHINGHYTEDIFLLQGVRQGCLLAPLLFAISMQPLMALLQNAISTGKVRGVKINSNTHIYHKLFADDLGVSLEFDENIFTTFHDCIKLYEHASGATLNQMKSSFLMLACETMPRWVTRMSCKICKKDEILAYLGAPIGVNLALAQVQQICLEKIRKIFSSWSNWSLLLQEDQSSSSTCSRLLLSIL